MAYPNKGTDASAPVLCWRAGSVAHIQFNRPEALNAIDASMAQAFLTACSDIAGDPQIRAVSVDGTGRVFTAGGDLAALSDEPVGVAQRLIEGMHGGLRLLATLQAPVIASVHGAVAGAGLGVLLGCDLAIAAADTRFSVAYPLIGASCDCSVSWGLPRAVGLRKALELALLAESFDATEALRLGLVNWVVPPGELQAQTERIIKQISTGPTAALGYIKRLMRASLQRDLETHLDAEAHGFLTCATTQDFAEGVGAFLNKRQPNFTGN